MIKAYLVGITTLYEGEDIEVRYSIFDDEGLINKKSIFLRYKKPAIVGLVAMKKLFRELEKYMDMEIKVIINDGALYEAVNGTSGTKNRDVLENAKDVRTELRKFRDIEIINVTGDHKKLKEWNETLKA